MNRCVSLVYDFFMDHFYFQNTNQLQDWIIKNAHPKDLVLTSGGRMARQILHRFREHKLSIGTRCWLPINTISLNEWLKSIWTEIWPEYMAASKWIRLLLWLKALQELPPPRPFHEGLTLAEDLDTNYAILIRHLMPPSKRRVIQPLAQWSLEVTKIFKNYMINDGLIHPVEIPIHIDRIFSKGKMEKTHFQKIDFPKRIILSGLDQSSPLEKQFFSCLDRVTNVIWLETRDSKMSHLEATMLPNTIQEVEWVVEKAIGASRELPLHRIGIVVTDMKTYCNLFERILGDILGKRAGGDYSSFNITMGKPLIRSSLAQASLLPIRLALAGESRIHIFSLLQSPYYEIWTAQRHKLAMLDRLWRKENLNGNLQQLINSAKKEYPLEAEVLNHLKVILTPLLNLKSICMVKDWNKSIHEIWKKLGFPVLAGEEDQITWEHLQEGIRQIDRDLYNERMSLKKYFQWLSFFCNRELFSVKGYENAGLQVMGLIEARGLSFDRLFITGMVSGLLPQPARCLPFMSPEERHKVQGGTAEDQYRFAQILFQKLIATCPEISLSRPEQRDGDPLVQSPFWPKKENSATVDLWNIESPIWARCRWLEQARIEVRNKTGKPITYQSGETCKEPVPIPLEISVTALESGITCPFRFFALHCLQIDPLQETEPGLSLGAIGTMIHKCLSKFVEEARRRNLDIKEDWNEVRTLLKKEAMRLLLPLANQFPWHVELKRWINEEFQGNNNRGLLYRWLEEERCLWEKGFRWLSAEVPFSGLILNGHTIRISGRIDRVDQHTKGNYICWDYKTGQIPTRKDLEELRASQIFPYISAIRKGLTHISISPNSTVNGGYIRLDSEGKIRLFDTLFNEEDWKRLIQMWEARISEFLNKLGRGDIRPYPMPIPTRKDEGACKNCPIRILCGYELLGYKDSQHSE